jgi:hypothetical protein
MTRDDRAMTAAFTRRARALDRLTAALRGERGVLPDVSDVSDVSDGPDAWSDLLALAAAHELLPALWVRQHEAGELTMPAALAATLEREAPAGRAVPEAVVRRAYDRQAERAQRMLQHGVDLLERLAAADVRAVPLKGLHALLAGWWRDPAMRTMADLDVLVDAADASRAYALLLAAGYEEHPEPIGEHADHHLPMLCDGDVTVELHVEPLVSRWRGLAPAEQMLSRAGLRSTGHGARLLADDTDTFVHLVAHAQLQEETYTLLGLPLRALFETARLADVDIHVDVRWPEARARFARAGVGHVLDAHLDATRRWFGASTLPAPSPSGARRAALHTRLVELGVAEPRAVDAWTYAVRVPRSFTASRMHAEFGPGEGGSWLWQARARHAARRLHERVARHGAARAQ